MNINLGQIVQLHLIFVPNKVQIETQARNSGQPLPESLNTSQEWKTPFRWLNIGMSHQIFKFDSSE